MENNYPEKFDRSALTEHQKNILTAFFDRRRIFDNFLKEKEIPIFTCPGCGYPSLPRRDSFEMCRICGWEDDGQDDDKADEIWGGPNTNLSLTQNRLEIGQALHEIAEKVHGKINTNSREVLPIVASRDKEIEKILRKISVDADLVNFSFKHYEEAGQEFLSQLIKRTD